MCVRGEWEINGIYFFCRFKEENKCSTKRLHWTQQSFVICRSIIQDISTKWRRKFHLPTDSSYTAAFDRGHGTMWGCIGRESSRAYPSSFCPAMSTWTCSRRPRNPPRASTPWRRQKVWENKFWRLLLTTHWHKNKKTHAFVGGFLSRFVCLVFSLVPNFPLLFLCKVFVSSLFHTRFTLIYHHHKDLKGGNDNENLRLSVWVLERFTVIIGFARSCRLSSGKVWFNRAREKKKCLRDNKTWITCTTPRLLWVQWTNEKLMPVSLKFDGREFVCTCRMCTE